jgi:hypothetical protein
VPARAPERLRELERDDGPDRGPDREEDPERGPERDVEPLRDPDRDPDLDDDPDRALERDELERRGELRPDADRRELPPLGRRRPELDPPELDLGAEGIPADYAKKGPRRAPSHEKSGGDLLSQGVSSQVPSARVGLTTVFGMGTGVTPPLWPPKSVVKDGAQGPMAWRTSP